VTSNDGRPRKGRPRIGGGFCRIGIREHILGARRQWREQALRVVRRGDVDAAS
jgi:hypothetical protein